MSTYIVARSHYDQDEAQDAAMELARRFGIALVAFELGVNGWEATFTADPDGLAASTYGPVSS